MTALSDSPALLADNAPGENATAAAGAERFVIVALVSCIFLQRFAIPLSGEFKIPIATPIVLAAAVLDLLVGRLVLDARRTLVFCALAAFALVPTSLNLIIDFKTVPSSFPSLAYALAVTVFGILSFGNPMPEDRFYRYFVNYLLVVAVAGILQFFAQFAGVFWFQFSGFVPMSFLMEDKFVIFQTLEYGFDVYRSNGFFLLEPSYLGQFMAIAIIIEWLSQRRPLWLVLYATAMLVAVSGTGFLVLVVFALCQGLASGVRGIVQLLIIAAVVPVVLFILNLLLPDIATTILDRSGEMSTQGSSGSMRFVGAFLILRDVFQWAPWAVVTGVGPGTSEHLIVPYTYLPNTVTKYIVEYGIGGFVLYMAMILTASRTGRQRAMLLPLLFLLLFTGQNEQFSIVVFPVLLIITVARLREDG